MSQGWSMDESDCLHNACYHNYVNLSKATINQGCNINYQNKLSDTPLHPSCRQGSSLQSTSAMLSHPEIKLFLKNKDCETPYDILIYRV